MKRKTNSTSSEFMKKRTAVIIVVAAALVVGVLGFLSSGFTNSDVNTWIKERNPDNLLDYVMPLEDYNKGDGTFVDIAEDGTIRITGTIDEDSDVWEYKLGDVVLPAGDYILTCDKKCSLSNYVVTGEDANGTVLIHSDISGKNTMTLTTESPVTFFVRIYKKGDVNLTLRPVLNEGTKAADFYITKTIGD